jgi:hypothetical protein
MDTGNSLGRMDNWIRRAASSSFWKTRSAVKRSIVCPEGFLSTGGMSDMNADGVLHAFYRDAPYLFLGAAFTAIASAISHGTKSIQICGGTEQNIGQTKPTLQVLATSFLFPHFCFSSRSVCQDDLRG